MILTFGNKQEDALFKRMKAECDGCVIMWHKTPASDSSLHIGEPWYDFGNFEKIGLIHGDIFLTIWKAATRELVAFIPKFDKYFSTQSRGYTTHSENNETPETIAFSEEIVPTDEMKKAVVYFKNHALSTIIDAGEEICKDYNKEVEEAEKTLEDLKCNHKRAWKKIEEAENKLFKCQRQYDSVITRITETNNIWKDMCGRLQ